MESLGLLLAELWYSDLRKRVPTSEQKSVEITIAQFVRPGTDLDKELKKIQKKHLS